jgi:signal transduction histidine kinase
LNSISEVPARQIGMKAEAARFALAPFFGVLTLYALLGVALTALLYFTGAALGSFAIASLLVVLYALIPLAAWFGVRKARERHVPDLATLSADTAHEIRTPLLTMCVLLDELRRSTEPPTDWKESIDTLWSQMQICRRCLATMAPATDVERLGRMERICESDHAGAHHNEECRVRGG